MIKLTVNGAARQLDFNPVMPLLWAIRDHAGLTGTKSGCGRALCGACTLDLDGAAAARQRPVPVTVFLQEPATPVIAPAVANALSAASGQWFDRLPLRLTG